MLFQWLNKKMRTKAKAFGLVEIVIMVAISIAVSAGMARFMIGYNTTNQLALERMVSQTAVQNKINDLEIAKYDNLADEARAEVAGMGALNIEREVVISEEVTDPDTGGKKRDAVINVYKSGNSVPILTVTKTLSSQGSGSGVPVGTVIAWPFSTLPDDNSGKWLECNGQAVNASLYPKLAALTSYTPNYEGVFLRGFGNQATTDTYGTVIHQSDSLGSLQSDSIRNITGQIAGGADRYGYNGAFRLLHLNNSDSHLESGYTDQAEYYFDASRVVPTSNENRPVNRSVIYLIKAS